MLSVDEEKSVVDRLRAARADRELNTISDILEQVSTGNSVIPASGLYETVREISLLKGYLEHSDTRGWKRSGAITKDGVVNACSRAMKIIIGRCEGLTATGKPPDPNRLPAARHARRRRLRVF